MSLLEFKSGDVIDLSKVTHVSRSRSTMNNRCATYEVHFYGWSILVSDTDTHNDSVDIYMSRAEFIQRWRESATHSSTISKQTYTTEIDQYISQLINDIDSTIKRQHSDYVKLDTGSKDFTLKLKSIRDSLVK